MPSLVEQFGQCVRRLREAGGLSQRQLARRVRIPHNTIHQIEHGTSDATLSRAARLAEAFGMTLAEMIELATTSGDRVIG